MMAVIFVDFGPHPAHDFGKTSRKGSGRGRCATAAQPHSTSRCGIWRSRRWRQTHADRAIAYPRSTIIGARSWAFSSTGRSPVRIASGAAAAQRYVLRSCEFHGFVPPPGPRRPKLCNRWLSVTRCRSRSAVRRLCLTLCRRRRNNLLWMAFRPGGRCRAGCSRRAGSD